MFEWKNKLLGRTYLKGGGEGGAGGGDGGDGGDGGGDGTGDGVGGSSIGGASLSGLGGLGGFAGPASQGYGGGSDGMGTAGYISGLETGAINPSGQFGVDNTGFMNSFLNRLTTPMGVIGTLGSLALGGPLGLGISLAGTALDAEQPGLGSLAKGLLSLTRGNPIGAFSGLIGAGRQGLFGSNIGAPSSSLNTGGGSQEGIRSLSPSFLGTPTTTAGIQRSTPSTASSSSGLYGGGDQMNAMNLFELSQLLSPRS